MNRLLLYIAAAAVIVAVVACLYAGHQSRRAESSAIAADSARLAAAGVIVQREVSERELRREVLAAAARNSTLAAELERVRRAVGKVTPVRVEERVATGTATGEARYTDDSACGSRAVGSRADSGGGEASAVDPPPCLLAPGDPISVRVTDVEVRTEAGASAVVGTAEVWREAPPPRTRLFAAPWDARASTATTASTAATRPPRWSADATLWTDGWSAGLDRRVAGPVWAGATGGVMNGEARAGVRVRVAW